jgi:Zn-dependent M28 family amino/carboxypeptidase
MRRAPFFALVLLGLTATAGVAVATPIGSLIGQLSKSDYQQYVTDLVGFGTRYVNQPGNTAATNYLANTLNGFGLTVTYDDTGYYGARNVVATLPGLTNPNQILIIGAHFDSTSTNAANAPGADDNASGTAAVLEIASVLSHYAFDYTIRFIGFNAEEQGLIGSAYHAAQSKARGDQIVGMINLDMIAYTAGLATEDIEVMGDALLVESFLANASTYVPSLRTQGAVGNTWGSDHYYFHSSLYAGSHSLLLIEDTANEIWGGSNPYYHKTTDTADHLDYDFAFNVTKAAAATLASLAALVPEPSVILLMVPGLALALLRRRLTAAVQGGPSARR